MAIAPNLNLDPSLPANHQLATPPQPTDTITVLRSIGPNMTKTWKADGTISQYADALRFIAQEVPLSGLDDLRKLLTRLEADPTACVIRGKPRADWREYQRDHLPTWNEERGTKGKTPIGLSGDQILRRKELFTDEPHHWVMIDVDGFLMAPGEAYEAAIARYVETLPGGFHHSSYHWQLSSSAGHPKNEGLLKAHLWFWLHSKRTGSELRPWADSMRRQGVMVDSTLFSQIQAHYTAAPIFSQGAALPLFKRSGGRDGALFCVIHEFSERDIPQDEPKKSKHDLKDPRQKPGVIGAFHRVFDLEHVLDEVIPGEFEWIDSERLTWNGSASGAPGGVYVAGSVRLQLGASHSSWPWGSNRVACLWDIVRHFKFGYLDVETGDDLIDIFNEDPTRSASQSAMYEWAKSLPEVIEELEREKQEHQQRRRDQQSEAVIIGDGISSVPHAEIIQLEVALKRFVYVGDGKGVYDRDNPAHFLDLTNFKQFYAASSERRGNTKVGMPGLWAAHPDRVSVMARSFKAGDCLFITDPEGRKAVNTWRDFDRSGIEIDPAHVEIFVEHVEFIFGEEAPRFLNWLAHIEQRPGELSHTAWLSIATNTGLGRNWVSSVLARVWAGRVAANFDLIGMFEKGFNGRLAGKILACVDEIKAGGSEAWPHSEKLKSIVTEETREINPKYGRQFVEHNSVRWLIFSNHLGAIPLETNDRRWEVVINAAHPLKPDHYAKIYGLVKDQSFIDSVAGYLSVRNIVGYNPGAHAKANESKSHVVNVSKSDIDLACEAIVTEWPSEVIFSSDLSCEVFGVAMDRRANGIKSAMSRLGARPYGKQVKAGGKKERPWILRNIDKWIVAEPFAVSDEGMRGRSAPDVEDRDKANPDMAPAKATPIAAELGGEEQFLEVGHLLADLSKLKGPDFAAKVLVAATDEDLLPEPPYDYSKLKTALKDAIEGAKAAPIAAELGGEKQRLEIIDLYGDLVKAKGLDFARQTLFSVVGEDQIPIALRLLKTQNGP